MSWLSISQKYKVLPSSIGHGENDVPFVLWIYRNGTFESTPVIYIDEEGNNVNQNGQLVDASHGSIWGEKEVISYQGRYEPKTGRLSIVKPYNKEYFPVPQHLIDMLHEKFSFISKIYDF